MVSSRLILFILIAFGPVALASAQRVRWEPAGGSLALHQNNELSLLFEDCEPEPGFTPPAVDVLNFGPPVRGEQSSLSVVNGRTTRRRTIYFTFPTRPTGEPGRVTIPAFDIPTNLGPLRVEPATFTLVEPTVGGTNLTLDRAASAELTAGRPGPWWASEVVPLAYTLGVTARVSAGIAGDPEWYPAPLIAEAWGAPETYAATAAGDTRNHVLYRTRGYIRTPGRHRVGGVNQVLNVRVPPSGFSVFQSLQTQQFALAAPPLEVEVRPLPTPAPADFNGAVGQFTLRSRVVPEQVEVGEPLTWTLTLEGTGNWPDIPALPAREVSREFRVITPPPRRATAEGKLFDATLGEDVVLVGTRPGTYTLGPVSWSYFDPAHGDYARVMTEPVTVTIVAPAAPDPTNAVDYAPFPEDRPRAASTTPPAPPALLRDPLPAAPRVASPWSLGAWLTRLGLTLVLLPVAWVLLALVSARRSDPTRPAREAHRRLRRQLAAAALPSPHFLREWRDLSARAWALGTPTPTSEAFARDPAWQSLWREADAHLFGDQVPLPADWLDRARAAAAARPWPHFRWRTLWRRHHFFPVLLAGLTLFTLPPESHAADPTAAYTRGDYATAAAAWRAELSTAPTTWSAHHNLALALAQQNRWEQAAAHAAAAFVQNPRDSVVRWHLTHTFHRASLHPPHLGGFAHTPGPRHRLAALTSPAGWQRLAWLAVGLLVLAGLLHMLIAHRLLTRRLGGLRPVLVMLALVLGVATAQSWMLYGAARDSRAVIVPLSATLRSIPTDLDIDQETSPLAAGALAVVDREFLGWRRLVFANGQTGWLRAEATVPLWQAPAPSR
jgi:tetratricopeptide (TPR) repeat protein